MKHSTIILLVIAITIVCLAKVSGSSTAKRLNLIRQILVAKRGCNVYRCKNKPDSNFFEDRQCSGCPEIEFGGPGCKDWCKWHSQNDRVSTHGCMSCGKATEAGCDDICKKVPDVLFEKTPECNSCAKIKFNNPGCDDSCKWYPQFIRVSLNGCTQCAKDEVPEKAGCDDYCITISDQEFKSTSDYDCGGCPKIEFGVTGCDDSCKFNSEITRTIKDDCKNCKAPEEASCYNNCIFKPDAHFKENTYCSGCIEVEFGREDCDNGCNMVPEIDRYHTIGCRRCNKVPKLQACDDKCKNIVDSFFEYYSPCSGCPIIEFGGPGCEEVCKELSQVQRVDVDACSSCDKIPEKVSDGATA